MGKANRIIREANCRVKREINEESEGYNAYKYYWNCIDNRLEYKEGY